MYGNSPSDMGFLSPQFRGDVQMFFANSPNTTSWQQWIKPSGVTMINMFCLGGGGGGGGGQTAAVAGGGGGGASGAFTSLMIPAIFLPDVLKIIVGAGGQGGATATAGTAGANSYITLGAGVTAGTTIPNLLLAALGGGAGGTGNGGAAGVAGITTTIAQLSPLSKLGLFSNTGTAANAGYGGQAGVAGGVGGAGNVGAMVAWATIPFSGGGGGAGIRTSPATGGAGGAIQLNAAVDFADGTFTPSAGFIPGGLQTAGNGNPGLKSQKPFLNTGGSGAGNDITTAGANGGDGGYGCGGGGGSGSSTAGGRGGNGGSGLVVIISW